MTTAFVTGACGFVGRRVVDLLVEDGQNVVASDLSDAPKEVLPDDVEFRAADLTDPDSMSDAMTDVDVVYHTAALFSYSVFVDWEAFERVNVDGTDNLFAAAVEDDVERVVLWSSAGVYAPASNDELPISEDHRREGESKYDRSKVLQEDVAWRYCDEGLDVVVLRPAPIYGPGSRYGVARLWRAVERGFLRVYPTERGFKLPLVHVDDVCRAAVHLASEGERCTAYNVVDDQEYDAGDVLRY
ncbi:MAG: NAD-dependent epimerase/dehydratase family protein, partial [Halobacteriota archaeon]